MWNTTIILVVSLLMESLWIVLNQAFFETYRKPNLHILCLNVNGVTSKWEKESCLRLFSKYDIVCFSELKCNYVFTLPGFNCVRSRIIPGEETRGGCSVTKYGITFLVLLFIRIKFGLNSVSHQKFYMDVYILPQGTFQMNHFLILPTNVSPMRKYLYLGTLMLGCLI